MNYVKRFAISAMSLALVISVGACGTTTHSSKETTTTYVPTPMAQDVVQAPAVVPEPAPQPQPPALLATE